MANPSRDEDRRIQRHGTLDASTKSTTDTHSIMPQLNSPEEDIVSLYERIASMNMSDQRALLQQFTHILQPPPSSSNSMQPSSDTSLSNQSYPLYNHTHHRLGGIVPSNKTILEALNIDAMEAILFNTVQLDDSPQASEIQKILQSLDTLSFQQQTYIWNTLNGQEYPYPLSCPHHYNTVHHHHDHHHNHTNEYSVVVSYHVGLINNWKDIVRNQMTTLELCGLGHIMTRMFVTYTKGNTNHDFQELKHIMNRYSFASKMIYQKSDEDIIPFEAPAMNILHEYCMKELEMESTQKIVTFYFHNKGSSRYHSKWRQRSVLEATFTYSYSLFWRKYMEYFLLERPGLCINQIIYQEADACGVHLIDHADGDDLYYSGNFWAASCKHIQSLQPVPFIRYNVTGENPMMKPIYNKGERWLGIGVRKRGSIQPKFVSLHNNTNGLYRHHIHPNEYSDYSYRWL